jgi:cell wall assembly regulator SMI1
MKTLLARLDKWLAQHRQRFHDNLQPGASAAQLTVLAKNLGHPLPGGLQMLLGWHNGQGDDYVGYFENHWLLMSTGSIAAAKQELDAGAVDGWKSEWIPFFDDDGGDYLVLDTSKKEPPVLGFYLDQGAKAQVVASSLQAWLEDFVTAVEAGDYSEEPERGTFKRRKAKGGK